MAGGLQNHLQNLHLCADDGDVVGNAAKAHAIVGELGHVCLQDVTEKDVGKLFHGMIRGKCPMSQTMF